MEHTVLLGTNCVNALYLLNYRFIKLLSLFTYATSFTLCLWRQIATMKLFHFITILSFNFCESNAKILTCKESVESDVCFNMESIKDYVASKNPTPLPTEIHSSIKIRNIIDVDEIQQTLTLSLKAHLEWTDRRLDVKRSKDDIEK